jgi:HD-GYP domain-containing protein (c-di-GMP phosphodiesterase class II)
MEPVLQSVAAKFSQTGASMEAWDADGAHVASLGLAGAFCKLVRSGGCECLSKAGELAREVLSDGNPRRCHTPWGCWIVAAPVHRRRRRVGVVTACFPPRDLAEDDEQLARLCDQCGLDLQATRDTARKECWHHSDEVHNLLPILEWTVDYEQRLHSAEHELQTLSTNLATAYEELSLLYRISGSMRVNQPPKEFLEKVCDGLVSVMGVSAAVALVYAHPPGVEQDLLVVCGDPGLVDDEIRHLAEAYIGPQFLSGQGYLNNDFPAEYSDAWPRDVRSVIAVPLVTDEHMGMLLGLNKLSGEFSSVDMKLLSSIADQVTAFLTNNRLYAELQDLLMGVFHALTATIDAKDPYTCGHSQRVALVSRRLAVACELPPQRVEEVYLSALLHDIGKIGVPDRVLSKPGKLTGEEYDMMKRHPAAGAKILGGIRQMEGIVTGILTHHERPDGGGYPRGLTAGEIPIEGAIIGLSDAFDAMTSQRTYRDQMSVEEAVAEIRRNAGTQFNSRLVDALITLGPEKLLRDMQKLPSAVDVTEVLGERE